MHSMTRDPSLSRLRKRPLEADAATSARAAGEIDIAGCATIAYSSENSAHPIEHMLDGRCGPGATRWISARPDTVEHIVVEFDRPQAISRLVYEVEEAMRERARAREGPVFRKCCAGASQVDERLDHSIIRDSAEHRNFHRYRHLLDVLFGLMRATANRVLINRKPK